jgi:hypothetical protein
VKPKLKLQVFPQPLVHLLVILIAFHATVDGAPTLAGPLFLCDRFLYLLYGCCVVVVVQL